MGTSKIKRLDDKELGALAIKVGKAAWNSTYRARGWRFDWEDRRDLQDAALATALESLKAVNELGRLAQRDSRRKAVAEASREVENALRRAVDARKARPDAPWYTTIGSATGPMVNIRKGANDKVVDDNHDPAAGDVADRQNDADYHSETEQQERWDSRATYWDSLQQRMRGVTVGENPTGQLPRPLQRAAEDLAIKRLGAQIPADELSFWDNVQTQYGGNLNRAVHGQTAAREAALRTAYANAEARYNALLTEAKAELQTFEQIHGQLPSPSTLQPAPSKRAPSKLALAHVDRGRHLRRIEWGGGIFQFIRWVWARLDEQFGSLVDARHIGPSRTQRELALKFAKAGSFLKRTVHGLRDDVKP